MNVWYTLKDFLCCRLSYDRIAEFATGTTGSGQNNTNANSSEMDRELKRMKSQDEYKMIRDHDEHSTAIRLQMNQFTPLAAANASSTSGTGQTALLDREHELLSRQQSRVDSPPLELLTLERRHSAEVLRQNARNAKEDLNDDDNVQEEGDEDDDDEDDENDDEMEEIRDLGLERKLSSDVALSPAHSERISRRFRPSFFSKDGCWPYIIFSQSFEWNIRLILMYSLFDSSSFRINKNMLGEKGIRSLQRRFFILGLINFLLLPFILLFILLFFILKHAEELHSKKTDFSLRQWTPYAMWKMREFNELKHFFDRRMEISAQAAIGYIQQFPSPILHLFAQCVAFVSGAIVGILLLLTFSDSSLLTSYTILNRSLLWHLAFFSLILAVSRSFLPSSSTLSAPSPYGYSYPVYTPPSSLLKEVIKHTHYFPNHWKRMSLNSNAIYEEFKWMYRPRLMSFLYEIVSVLFLPIILCYSMPRSCRKIANFMEQSTMTVEGVGDICAYAIFDLETHGDKRYANNGMPARENEDSTRREREDEFALDRAVSEVIEEKDEEMEQSQNISPSKKASASSPPPPATHTASGSSSTADHFLNVRDAGYQQQDRNHSNTASAAVSLSVHGSPQKLRRCNGGKLEKSFLSFAMNHPNWRADEDHQAHGGTKFLTQLSQSIAPLPLAPLMSDGAIPNPFAHLAKSSILRKPASMHALHGHNTHQEDEQQQQDHDDEDGVNGRGSPFVSPAMSRNHSEDSENPQHVLQLQQTPGKSGSVDRRAREKFPHVPSINALHKNSPQKSSSSGNADDLSASQHLVSSFYDLLHNNADKSMYLLNNSNASLLQQQPLPVPPANIAASSLLLHRLHSAPSLPTLSGRGLSIQSPSRPLAPPRSARMDSSGTFNEELAASLYGAGAAEELFAVLENRAQETEHRRPKKAGRSNRNALPPVAPQGKKVGTASAAHLNSTVAAPNLSSSSSSAFTAISGTAGAQDEISPRPRMTSLPPPNSTARLKIQHSVSSGTAAATNEVKRGQQQDELP